MKRTLFVTGAIILCFAVALPSFRVLASTHSPAQKSDIPTAGTKGYTNPKCAYCPAPKYSKEGRLRKIQGPVVLGVDIGTDGRAHNVTVTRSLGYGLDEQAVKAVRDEWNFKPASGPDGKPAAVRMMIEIDFHLY
jgi:TonB family protein